MFYLRTILIYLNIDQKKCSLLSRKRNQLSELIQHRFIDLDVYMPAFLLRNHQPRIRQHFQMMRNCRLRKTCEVFGISAGNAPGFCYFLEYFHPSLIRERLCYFNNIIFRGVHIDVCKYINTLCKSQVPSSFFLTLISSCSIKGYGGSDEAGIDLPRELSHPVPEVFRPDTLPQSGILLLVQGRDDRVVDQLHGGRFDVFRVRPEIILRAAVLRDRDFRSGEPRLERGDSRSFKERRKHEDVARRVR